MPLVSDRWAILRLESLAPIAVIEYRDHSGALPRLCVLPPGLMPSLPEPTWLAQQVQSIAGQSSPRTSQAAIFLDAHPSLAAVDLESFFALVGAVTPVRLSRAAWLPRSPFTLPLRVVAVGPDAEPWFADLRQQHWARSEAVERYGLDLHLARRDSGAAIGAALPHVVVTEEPLPVLGLATDLPEPRRPRLVIWIDPTLDSPAPAVLPADVPGVAILRVSPLTPAALATFVRELFYQFTHDRPLHGPGRARPTSARRWRQSAGNLLAEGNPLAFLFRALGDADLVLK